MGFYGLWEIKQEIKVSLGLPLVIFSFDGARSRFGRSCCVWRGL